MMTMVTAVPAVIAVPTPPTPLRAVVRDWGLLARCGGKDDGGCWGMDWVD